MGSQMSLENKLRAYTWVCSKCGLRSLRAWFDEHFATGTCSTENFVYVPELDMWQFQLDYHEPYSSEDARKLIEALVWEESRRERKRNNPILKRGSNTRYWIELALEKLFKDNSSRKALEMQVNEERLQILRLRLSLLRTQLLQYLDECDVDALDGVNFLEDTEVIVEKLMTELAFEFGCSITYSG